LEKYDLAELIRLAHFYPANRYAVAALHKATE